MTTEPVTVTGQGVTVDLLIWRRFRRPIEGLTEQVLALNPGLAQLGPYLPPGTTVLLPLLQDAETPPTREVVQLWD
jgi:phage tail protein X